VIEQGDIYLADMNPPRKSKPGKLRPVLVIQATDLTEAGKQSITIVPLTTHLLPANKLRTRLTVKDTPGLTQDSDILVDEIHTLHQSLFIEKIGRVSESVLENILSSVLFILGIPRIDLRPR
jgi:mRNA interferase MazF